MLKQGSSTTVALVRLSNFNMPPLLLHTWTDYGFDLGPCFALTFTSHLVMGSQNVQKAIRVELQLAWKWLLDVVGLLARNRAGSLAVCRRPPFFCPASEHSSSADLEGKAKHAERWSMGAP